MNVPIAVLSAMLALTACGDDGGSPASSAAAQATAKPAPKVVPRSTDDGCRAVAPPVPARDPDGTRSRRRLDPDRRNVAFVRTNCGSFRILLDAKHAPKTTASFAGLVRAGYYDGLTFHRIARPGGNDYVIQGGDPTGTGDGGPGYSVVERPPKSTTYDRGVVAMAKTPSERPGTSGSQFFIVTAKRTRLAPDYALLGRVYGETKAVRRIAAIASDPVSEMPVDPVVIKSIRMKR